MLDNNLGLFVIIAIEVDASGNIEKNIFIFDMLDNPVDQELKNKAASLKAFIETKEDMQLSNKTELTVQQLGGAGSATYYTIGNNRYSRKAYEAVVKGDQSW